MIANTHYGYVGKGGGVPKFTYTGNYNVRDDGVVELLTSGTLVFLNPAVIDIFCVGGGGAGCSPLVPQGPSATYYGAGGGGGGYSATSKRFRANGSYEIAIGAGGTGGVNGGTTSFGTALTAQGGISGTTKRINNRASECVGFAGGSGGGGGVSSSSDYGTGGSDGNNGENGYPAAVTGGTGQGSTTREFGESTGKLYAGGGGGGRGMYAQSPIASMGGAGGGGAGGFIAGSNIRQAAAAGVANTGGGGGGGAVYGTFDSYVNVTAANGGTGICCFRAAK